MRLGLSASNRQATERTLSSRCARSVSWITLVAVAFSFAMAHPAWADIARSELSLEHRDFFETKVRPVLITHCYECHSKEEGKQKGRVVVG